MCAHILRIHTCGNRWERVRIFGPPRSGDELVPSDVSHWLFPAEQYLGLTKLGTDGILRSREDSRWPTVSPPSSDILHSSPIVGEFVTSGCLSDQLWTNRCKKCERFLNCAYVWFLIELYSIVVEDKKKLEVTCVKKWTIYNTSSNQYE